MDRGVKRLWLTGSRGLLAQTLGPVLQAAGWQVTASGHETDIADLQALKDFARAQGLVPPRASGGGGPAWIVNCAGWTAVDGAQTHREACLRANVQGPKNLARLARSLGARLVQLSSDYVFSLAEGIWSPGATPPRPWTESDRPAPRGVYGQSKLEGELAVLQASAENLVIRSSWIYGGRRGFPWAILKGLLHKDRLGVVDDQWGSPTLVQDLARGLAALLDQPPSRGGIWHLAGRGSTSRYRWAQAIRQGLLVRWPGLHLADLEVLASRDWPAPAPRPGWSALDSRGFDTAWPALVRPWEAALEDWLADPELPGAPDFPVPPLPGARHGN